MAIFTSAAVATFLGISASFFTAAIAFGLNAAVAIGLSLAARALSSKPDAAQVDNFSVQGKLQSGGDVPRSFQLGYSVTAGSLAYANTWGFNGATPNAYLTQVIALQDVPGGNLVEVWINGELCSLGALHPEYGYAVPRYAKDGADHLWVKFFDGTQTTADAFLVSRVSSATRPYQATRVGTGVAYAVCTALVEDKLFSGFPTFKFALSGIPLYDPSKDSSVLGGSGTHRWSDRSTWGGDGDNLPAVQLYNLLRGVTYNGQWLYGLQGMSGARLPATNWIAQIGKCRAAIQGESGLEPTYRSGGQVNVDAQLGNAVEALLTACQGRLSEIGGFYKVHLGAPDSPTFAFTDDDILSTEEQTYRPFFALSDSINGIAAKYPLPAEGWNTKVAPPIYRSDLEAKDGGRRLLANPSFDFVPYSAQVQRLMSSALEEAQRARTHNIALPPAYWIIEPGDIGAWTSARNGYVAKLFRADAVADRANLDVGASLTEVDPSDYDWNHAIDFEPVSTGPTVFERPAPQGIKDWAVDPDIIVDNDGYSRRAAIRLRWDGSLPGVKGVTYQVRLKNGDGSLVTSGNTDQLSVGALRISHNLLPLTQYQARGQYIPIAPRDMLWSDWMDVTTPDVRTSLIDFENSVRYQVTTIQDLLFDQVALLEQRIASITKSQDARNWLDKKDLRSDLSATYKAATASISSLREVMVAADAAMAQDILNLYAGLDGSGNGKVNTTAKALASLDQNFATYQSLVSALFGSGISTSNTVTQAIAGVSGNLATFQQSVSQQLGPGFSSVNTVAQAIGTLNSYAAAKYAVTLDVNNYAIGFTLINGGGGIGSCVFLVDKFQIAFPGVTGGAAVPIFTVANVNGAPKIALRADVYADGMISATMIAAGAITAVKIAAGAIDATKIQAYSISTTQLAINGVAFENLIKGAATDHKVAPITGTAIAGLTGTSNNSGPIGTINMTTLLGRVTCLFSGSAISNGAGSVELLVDGGVVASFSFQNSFSGSYSWTVGGLSNASHTFAWRVNVIVFGSSQYGNGQATVFELRNSPA